MSSSMEEIDDQIDEENRLAAEARLIKSLTGDSVIVSRQIPGPVTFNPSAVFIGSSSPMPALNTAEPIYHKRYWNPCGWDGVFACPFCSPTKGDHSDSAHGAEFPL